MIVECAGCRTRFRLPDEKVRSQGTRVRCSRCATTFLVYPELPALDEPSVHDMHTRVQAIPSDLLGALREEAAPAPAPPLGPDVFADLDFDGPQPPPTPAGRVGSPSAPGIPLQRPPPLADDPLALLGPPPPLPAVSFAPPPQAIPSAPGGSGLELVTERWQPPAPAAPEAWTRQEAAPGSPPAPRPEATGTGLELATGGWKPPGAPQQAVLGVAGERRREPPADAVPNAAPSEAPQRRAPAQQAPVAENASGGLLRAISGLAVLATALVGFVLVRGGVPANLGEALAAFGVGAATGPAEGTELRVERVHTGRYPTAAGELLYVRGEIASHAEAPRGPAVRVVAELRDGAQVLARGEALAGGEPSPEQVAALAAAEDWTPLAERLGRSWAAPLLPGERAPFLVVLGPAPAGAEDLRVRITAAPVELPGRALPGAVATP